jgi:hypothetical protein
VPEPSSLSSSRSSFLIIYEDFLKKFRFQWDNRAKINQMYRRFQCTLSSHNCWTLKENIIRFLTNFNIWKFSNN